MFSLDFMTFFTQSLDWGYMFNLTNYKNIIIIKISGILYCYFSNVYMYFENGGDAL